MEIGLIQQQLTSLVIFAIFCGYLCSYVSSSDVSLPRNVKVAKSCLDSLSECRKNSSCHSMYRKVKRTCKNKRNMCHNYKSMVKCPDHIDFLKENGFGEKCHCMPGTITPLKKVYTCSSVYNLLFANPCYDHGVREREQKQRLSMSSTKPAQTLNPSDVIIRSSTRRLNARMSPTGNKNKTTTVSVSNQSKKYSSEYLVESQPKNYFPSKNSSKKIISTASHLTSPKTAVQTESDEKEKTDNEILDGDNTNSVIKDADDLDVPSNMSKYSTSSSYDVVNHLEKDDSSDDSDDNAYKAIKVQINNLKKKYGILESKNEDLNINLAGKTSSKNKQGSVIAESKQSNSETVSHDNNAIILTAIIIASICIVLVLLLSITGWCYRRLKRGDAYEKKKPIHSAIIVASLYEERDLKLNRKTNFV